jgi:hypothetical protein
MRKVMQVGKEKLIVELRVGDAIMVLARIEALQETAGRVVVSFAGKDGLIEIPEGIVIPVVGQGADSHYSPEDFTGEPR